MFTRRRSIRFCTKRRSGCAASLIVEHEYPIPSSQSDDDCNCHHQAAFSIGGEFIHVYCSMRPRTPRQVLICCRSGPWSGQAHFTQLKDCVHNYYSFFDSREPSFRVSYPWICKDIYKGKTAANYGTEEHIENVFEKFRHSLLHYAYYVEHTIHVEHFRWMSPSCRALYMIAHA